jgi:hypothetical protein
MKKILLKAIFLTLLAFVQSHCQAQKEVIKYPKMVGDIEFDARLDKKDFELCNPNYIYQYFNTGGGLEYKGEKITLEKVFLQEYKPNLAKAESGLLRVRFVVNCKGQSDRFRMIGMDKNYQPKTFDKSITDQILKISSQLQGWQIKYIERNPIDYYQYLIFKLEKGHIKEILP